MVVTALTLGACSSDDSTVASVDLPSGGTLTGTWATTACFEDAGDGAKVIITFASSTDSGTFDVWFGNLSCTGTSDVTFAFTETFVIGSTVTTTGGNTATQVDFTTTGETITPNTATGASVVGGTVGTTVDTFDPATAVAEKDIFAIDTTPNPDQLRVGDEATAGTDGYPTALDPTIVLERQ